MRRFSQLLPVLLVVVSSHTVASSADVDHTLFTQILHDHVRDGRVDYSALREDARLQQYLETLSATDPATLADDDARLAFWINAYNAFTLQLICDKYPVKSINDLHFGGRILGTVIGKTPWKTEFITINGRTMHLDNIEHDIIRKQFDEPRIHFALVCAAVSCPPLRSEAYTAERLNEQLEDQAVSFMRDPENNSFDTERKVARISAILDWYGKDFGDSKAEVLAAVARYLSDDVARAIASDPEAWKVAYQDYDWALNE